MRFLLPALLLSAGAATAQPTLTSTTTLPTTGLTNTLYRASSATPGPAGANQTWDFTSVTSSASLSSSYEACPGTNQYCDTFPGANLTGLEVITSNTLFYNASSSALSIVGARGPGFAGGTAVNNYFSNPEDILRFPLSYNTTFTDTSRVTYTAFGFPARRTGYTTVTADGWGTLKVPGGTTYSNVLRVKRTATYYDTANTPIAPTTAIINITLHQWYSPAYKEFLMLIAQVSVPSQPTGTTVAWTDPIVAAGIDEAGRALAFSAVPNPAHDRIAVRWAAGTQATLTLQDMMGRTVAQTKGHGEMTMDVANLPRGMYLLRVTDAGGATATQKISLR